MDIGVDDITTNVPQWKRYNNKYNDLAFRYIEIYDFYFWATKILIFLFLPFLILWKTLKPFFRNVCQNKTAWNLIEEVAIWCWCGVLKIK